MEEQTIADQIIAAARTIAEAKCPLTDCNKSIQEVWIGGFISGYLNRTTEEIILRSKLNKQE